MVRSFPSYGSFTKALLSSERCYCEVCDYEPEASSSTTAIPTVTLANHVEMPLLGLEVEFRKVKKKRKNSFPVEKREDQQKRESVGGDSIDSIYSGLASVWVVYSAVDGRDGTTHSGGYYHDVVIYALRDCGYRMIDTARRYGVERELGIAWKESGVPRSELFLCSKLWPVDFGPSTREAFELSCEKLQTDYLDLYMTHFPVIPDWLGDRREVHEATWRQLELLYDEGRIRAIGVSNYSEDDLTELLEYCSVKPQVNQSEFHPWYNPAQLRSFCSENDILYTGYCPIAKGKFLDADVLLKMSSKYKKTPAQICLRWSLDHGVPVIPKSKEKYRIAENRNVFDFSLSADDLAEMSSLQENPKKLVRFEDLPDKFHLPDGYKLAGRVYGIPSANELQSYRSGFTTVPNVC